MSIKMSFIYRLLILALCFLAIFTITAFAKPKSTDSLPRKEAVLQAINKANSYWQNNNKPQVRAFWDHAAYQTGNMELYALTKNESYRQYAEAWADYNKWMGAKTTDSKKWKYAYGE